MEWINEPSKEGDPRAVLKDGDKVVCKVYLSPGKQLLRIVLPELEVAGQLKVDIGNRLIDFKRTP